MDNISPSLCFYLFLEVLKRVATNQSNGYSKSIKGTLHALWPMLWEISTQLISALRDETNTHETIKKQDRALTSVIVIILVIIN